MSNIKVDIKPTDKPNIYNMHIEDKNNIIDKAIMNVLSSLTDKEINEFSIVNNNLLYEQLVLRVLVDLFINNMSDFKKDYTYTVLCQIGNESYRFTVRDVVSGDDVGIKGITYGLVMY